MPILGLFPTGAESQHSFNVDAIASGRRSSAAVGDLQRNADRARRNAFATAYQSRGNPALAQRQAVQAGTNAQMEAGGQIASQRARDVEGARQEQGQIAAQRAAGINNAIGMAAQAGGTIFGGPAGGMAAKGAASAIGSGVTSSLTQQAPGPPAPETGLFSQQSQQYDKRQGGPSVTEDPSGAMGLLTAAAPTAPTPAISQVNPDFVAPPAQQPLTQPLPPPAAPPAAGLEALYSRMGNQRDPSTDLAYRRRFGQQYWGQQ